MPFLNISKIKAFIRGEPLVHFLIAASVLFAAYHWFARPVIEVSPPVVNGMRKEYESRVGRKATEAEVAHLVQDYLEDEVLFREALSTGLTHDNRVRAMLVETMRRSLRPVVKPPTDAELATLRAETPEIYRLPAQISFEHVTFSDEKNIPAGLLEKLRGGASAAGLGDAVRLANPLPATFQPQIEHMFGPEFTSALLKCEEGVWNGPIKSLRGIHFVRTLKREVPKDMPMDQIRTTLASQWNTVHENAEISRKVMELRKSYRISLPASPSAP